MPAAVLELMAARFGFEDQFVWSCAFSHTVMLNRGTNALAPQESPSNRPVPASIRPVSHARFLGTILAGA
jgi:hypothetical protein